MLTLPVCCNFNFLKKWQHTGIAMFKNSENLQHTEISTSSCFRNCSTQSSEAGGESRTIADPILHPSDEPDPPLPFLSALRSDRRRLLPCLPSSKGKARRGAPNAQSKSVHPDITEMKFRCSCFWGLHACCVMCSHAS